MIDVNNLHLTFNLGTPIENHVLRGMSFKIEEGEFVTVIGSNGAGKSTLLNVLSGDVFVDSGKVKISDLDVTAMPTWKRAAMVARVFQDPMAGTCENLTIEENLALAYKRKNKYTMLNSTKRPTFSRLMKIALFAVRDSYSPALNKELRRLFKKKLTMLDLGLEHRLTDLMGLLSGGQRQAVSLLMSSLQPSKILLLDEHTAALDPKTAEFVLQLTNQIVQENNLTTMMVTHSMRQALDYGTRTLMLHQGRVVLDVSGEERRNMKVEDLLHMFEKTRGEQISDDALLLG